MQIWCSEFLDLLLILITNLKDDVWCEYYTYNLYTMQLLYCFEQLPFA